MMDKIHLSQISSMPKEYPISEIIEFLLSLPCCYLVKYLIYILMKHNLLVHSCECYMVVVSSQTIEVIACITISNRKSKEKMGERESCRSAKCKCYAQESLGNANALLCFINIFTIYHLFILF